MALTIVLGLTILSVANYGSTFEFSGQLKPTIKPFSALPNQHHQGDQFKSVFGYNSVPPKPFGAPFEHFKQSYQSFQPYRTNYQPFGPYPGYPGPVVYPGHGGYQGPDAYRFDEPNHKPFGFQPFPAPFQPDFNQYKYGPSKKFNKNFPGLADFNQAGKYFQEHQFGAYHGPESPSAAYAATIIPAEHNIKQSKPKDTLSGKPFEFGLPKQTSFGSPSPPSFRYPVPSFPPVKSISGTASLVKSVPDSLVPVNAVKVEQKFGGAEITTAVVPSSSAQDDSAAVEQQSVDVTGEPSAVTPAADAQPTSPAQEDVASGVSSDAQPSSPVQEDVASGVSSDAQPSSPAQEDVTSGVSSDAQPSSPAQEDVTSGVSSDAQPSSPAQEDVTSGVSSDAQPSSPAQEDVTSGVSSDAQPSSPAQEDVTSGVSLDAQVPAAEVANNDETLPAEENKSSPPDVAPINSAVPLAEDAAVARTQELTTAQSLSESNEPSNVVSEQTASAPQDSAVQEPSPIVVAEQVKETSGAASAQASNEPSESSDAVSGPSTSQSVAAENKPATGTAAVNLLGLPVELQSTQFGPVPISDTSSVGQFGSSGFPPYFGPSVGAQQPSYYLYFDAPGFSAEELKAFTASFATQLPQSGQVLGSSAYPAVNNPQGVSINNPSAEIATLLESSNNAQSQDKAANDGKQIQNITPGSPLPSPTGPKTKPTPQPKFNSVQIIQNDPFNGQFPLLYDPSNSAAPLDTYKFYKHPSVSAWSSQASLASYSPESAFNNFGSNLHQGYLVEGSPTLTPLAKTVVQESGPTPLSISSLDHPLHSQVFKYSQSFVPYPGLVAGHSDAAAFQPFGVPSSTAAPASDSATTAAGAVTTDAAADASAQSTSAPGDAVESSSSNAPAGQSA